MTQLTDEQTIRDQAARDGVTHFATGIAAFRDGKLLVARRAVDDFMGGIYELPGGGVDPGETFTESAIRELLEETGLHIRDITGEFPGFDYQTPTKSKVRQLNYKVTVEPGDITLNPAEHDEYRWITAADIDDLNSTDTMRTCLHAAFAA